MQGAADYYANNETWFRRVAPIYELVVAPLSRLRWDVVAVSGARPAQSVLDVACGTGEQSLAFVRAGCSVVVVDLSVDMLARARAKVPPGANVQLVHDDATSLRHDTASFDVTTVSFGLHEM